MYLDIQESWKQVRLLVFDITIFKKQDDIMVSRRIYFGL